MFFNSLDFAIFFPIVFFLYWFVARNNLKAQNLLLLVASYFFYACWDYRFLFLLIFSTLLDYFTGLKMGDGTSQARKKFWFWLSVGINLGFLGIFKYYNFFADSFAQAVSHIGFHPSFWTLNVILPVGISFYTFHGLSYVIDIYKDRIKPERNFVDYSVFVSFFPLLVAGPIERSTHLLPQIKRERKFNIVQAKDGLRQILWGLFKKILVADTCASYANDIFAHHTTYSGSTLLLGGILFAFQIYGDFSGYSDIALGTARLLGVELIQNFAFPYFSRDIAEFWRRWHISLSSWFRDYVYVPLGGSRGGLAMKVRNTFIIFLLSGFWHGANWTFIIWGGLNALYFMPLLLSNKNRNNLGIVAAGRLLPSPKEFMQIGVTFFLTVLAWIFFRADSLSQAVTYIGNIFQPSLFSLPQVIPNKAFLMIAILLVIEWLQRDKFHGLQFTGVAIGKPLRWSLYYCLILMIFFLGNFGSTFEFIYFQF